MKFRDRKIRQECVKQSVGHTVPGCQLTVTVGHPGSCVPLSAVSHILEESKRDGETEDIWGSL